MSLESITVSAESLETLLAAAELYAQFLRETIHEDGARSAYHQFPKELKSLYDTRIDICEGLVRSLNDIKLDRRLEIAFDRPAAARSEEPESEPVAEKPIRKPSPRRKVD